jgi:hypothetical protein
MSSLKILRVALALSALPFVVTGQQPGTPREIVDKVVAVRCETSDQCDCCAVARRTH